jgi:HD-GYP domain-containing protein (c-di-GMP phosphodiesterase class II)
VVIKNINRERFGSAVARLKNQIFSYNNALPKGRHPLNISAGYDFWDQTSPTLIEVFKSADHRMLQEKIPKREDVRKSILQVLKATMVEKDTGTEQHMSRMTELARCFADKVGLSAEEAQKVVLATELHDIGKVVIPDEILNKTGPLTTEEFEVIKRHTETGYRIAKATPEISHVAEIILSAHERWDGRGYPQGLKGEEIPLLARMVFILDAYDVMRNDRPYRKGRTVLEAREELKDCRGSQFDPQLVDIFIAEVLTEEAA